MFYEGRAILTSVRNHQDLFPTYGRYHFNLNIVYFAADRSQPSNKNSSVYGRSVFTIESFSRIMHFFYDLFCSTIITVYFSPVDHIWFVRFHHHQQRSIRDRYSGISSLVLRIEPLPSIADGIYYWLFLSGPSKMRQL